MPKNGNHKIGPDDLRYDLVFFSTFEELTLPVKGPMEDAGVVPGGQALRAIRVPDTVLLRGQRREHGWQNFPDALLSGW